MIKKNLLQQFLTIALLIFVVIYICLGLLIPNALTPIYEENIYSYLAQPLELLENNTNYDDIDNEIAYIYINQNTISTSGNLKSLINISTNKLLQKTTQAHGKFNYRGKIYYYNKLDTNNGYKVAVTNSDFIYHMKNKIFQNILPILLITLLVIVGMLVLWPRKLVKKIEHLKEKIDNLDNDSYVDKYNYVINDELKVLSDAIDDMKITLQKEDEFKTQMYQNISHDFKTPLTVIKSYMEAIDDGVMDSKEGVKVINEQIGKLENKVHSLLYLNKLNYIKDLDNISEETIDITEVILESVKKFKIQRPDIKWQIMFKDEKTLFKGSLDMWETIIDNLLNNFMRYTEKNIKITLKNQKLVFYNDGPNIDEEIFNDIFSPYKKGIKGEFGLGLSIIRKTVSLLGYEINIKNEKKGVNFIIK